MKKSFRERDPLTTGVVGMAVVALFVFIAFNLTIFEGGTDYRAAFTEASGLKPNEVVRIAGVKVGKIKSVDLEGDHVKVSFNMNGNVHFGSFSRVQIKIGNILGSHYLDVQPSGVKRQSPQTEIPTSRTTPSYEVVPALQDLSGSLQKINIPQLGTAFNTLSQTLQGSPENVRKTLSGLRKISRAVASRDDSLNDLLSHSSNLSKTLADRSGDLSQLVSDGSLLLQELNNRRTAIGTLLSGTVSLSQQITGTIEENRATLHPALVNLHNVVNILERNQGNLEKAVQTLGPFVTTSGDATANGRWFDAYLQNLLPFPSSGALPEQLIGGRKSTTKTKSGAGKPGTTNTPGGDNPLPLIK